MTIVLDDLPVHGSPQDRGSADRFYQRSYNPHYYPNGTGVGERITEEFMTPEEIEEYKYGWANEEDRKEYR